MASTCKACNAPIYWVQTESSKWMCCDEGLHPYKLEPDGKDTVVLQDGTVKRVSLEFDGKPDGMGRIPHWVTCPYADKFRQKA